MALDERRSKFKVNHWQRKDGTSSDAVEREDVGNIGKHASKTKNLDRKASSKTGGTSGVTSQTSQEGEKVGFDELQMRSDTRGRRTDVKEVWFMGCHSDIGGGTVKNDERHKLSQIPLRWMIRQSFECDTGIMYNTAKLVEIGLDVQTLWPLYSPVRIPAFGPPPTYADRCKGGDRNPIPH